MKPILKKYKATLGFALLMVSPFLIMAREVRKMNPPKLEAVHLGKRILCHRPMRRGAPNMSLEQRDGKNIAHCYGWGGSGWTLGPGGTAYVNNLLINSDYAIGLTEDTPITVIGAGALGLFAAYDLVQRGFTSITVVAENFDGLTSHNAGGLLAPVSMDNAPELQRIIDKVGIDAYVFYDAIAKKIHPDFADGAVVVPTYFENRDDSGLEPYVGVVMQPAKDVTLDFGNGTKRDLVSYDDGIFIDTAKMMTALHEYLDTRVTFVQRKVNTISELSDSFIINCSGGLDYELNNDGDMVSVQGHLIMLKDQNVTDLQHMILVYFGESVTASGQNIKRSFYIFPKQLPNTGSNDVGVIGGTFIEGATFETPNTEEFDILLQGAKDFYGIK
jgi:D-amino-acid oxidase